MKVFISHASEDDITAKAICRMLEEDGIRCWYAARDALPGVDYEESIIDAISSSDLMVLILSSKANESPHIKREIQNACIENPPIPIIPFRTEDVTLNKALRYYLGSVHWIDASRAPLQESVNRLLDVVKGHLIEARQHIKTESTKIQLERMAMAQGGELEIWERSVQDVAVIELVGRMTIGEGSVAFRKAMAELGERGSKKIILNFSGVSYIDSAGIGELSAQYTKFQKLGAQVRLFKLSQKVTDLLTITKLLSTLNVYENEAQALWSLRKRADRDPKS